MAEPLETSEILSFTKTVESKSLSRAAAELRVPRATISRRLARLEERLGVRLLRRTTRSLVVTEAGSAFYQRARMALDAVADAEKSVHRPDDDVRGDLRVSCPPIQIPSFFRMICDFQKKHPAVRLQVHFSTQRVDLRRDGYDIAFRAGPSIEPGLVARTLARSKTIGVASAAYVKAHGKPRSPRELKDHACIIGFERGELPLTHWRLANGRRVKVTGNLMTNEPQLALEAALEGLGIAMLPAMFVEPHVESGKLVRILDGMLEAEGIVAIVYADREFVPAQVRAFVEAIVAWAKTEMPGVGKK